MVSVKVLSPQQARDYYTKDDYYYDQESTWWGKGAEGLDIAEQIEKADWKEACVGAIKGERLNQAHRKENYVDDYRVGADIVFSASKSASVLALSDPRIIEAHERAVTKALEYMQENLMFYRHQENNVRQFCQAENALVARFQHQTSRELQPQLHTHAVVLNTVTGADGKRRSLSNEQILSSIKSLGQMYRNEFALEMKKLGYGIEITNRSEGFWEVKGVSEKMLEHFSERRKQVLAEIEKKKNDKEFMAKYPGISDTQIAQIATTSSRQPKEHLSQEEFLERNEKELKEKFGVSSKTLQEQCLKLGRKRTFKKEKVDLSAAIREGVKMLTEQETAFSKEDLIREAGRLTASQASIKDLEEAFNKADLVDLGKDMSLEGKGRHLFTTKEIMAKEQEIVRIIENSRNYTSHVVNLRKSYVASKITGFEQSKNEPVRFTLGQGLMAEEILGCEQFIKVQGDAGTGKTTSLEFVTKVLREQGVKPILIAPSNQAVQELRKATGIEEAYTIYSFKQKGPEKVSRDSVIVMDEGSMATLDDFHHVVRMVDKSQCKAVFIGDDKQFKAIGQGETFKDLDASGVRKVELTEKLRQKTPELQRLIQCFEEEKFEDVERIMTTKDMLSIVDVDELSQNAATEYFRMIDQGKESCVLTQYNKDKDEINEMIRKEYQNRGIVKGDNPVQILRDRRLSLAWQQEAENYEVGNVIIVHGKHKLFKKGQKLAVVDVEKKARKMKVADIKTGKIHAFQPEQNTESFNVYERKNINLGRGDRIIFNGNTRLKDGQRKFKKITNGQTGIVEKISKEWLHIKTDRGQKIKFSTNLNRPGSFQQFECGYAMTTHKSQGASIDAPVWMARADFGTTKNAAYVALTRSKTGIKVITNHKDALFEKMQIEQKKESIHRHLDNQKGLMPNIKKGLGLSL